MIVYSATFVALFCVVVCSCQEFRKKFDFEEQGGMTWATDCLTYPAQNSKPKQNTNSIRKTKYLTRKFDIIDFSEWLI